MTVGTCPSQGIAFEVDRLGEKQMMKTLRSRQLPIAYALICILASSLMWIALPWKGVQAQDDGRKQVTAKGINFDLPEDWPIEERGGAVGPIPIEEYLAMKFRKVDAKFDEMESGTGGTKEKLAAIDERLTKLENTLSEIDTRLSDLEQWLKYGNARKL